MPSVRQSKKEIKDRNVSRGLLYTSHVGRLAVPDYQKYDKVTSKKWPLIYV